MSECTEAPDARTVREGVGDRVLIKDCVGDKVFFVQYLISSARQTKSRVWSTTNGRMRLGLCALERLSLW